MQNHLSTGHYTPPAEFVALLELEHAIPKDICDSLRSEMALIPLALAYAAGIENAVYIPAFWTSFHSWSQLRVNRKLMQSVLMGRAIDNSATQDTIVECFKSIAASIDPAYQAHWTVEQTESVMLATQQMERQNELEELSKIPFFDLPLLSELDATDFLAGYCPKVSLPQAFPTESLQQFNYDQFDLDEYLLSAGSVPVTYAAFSFEIPACDPAWVDIAPVQDFDAQMSLDNAFDVGAMPDYTSLLGQQMVWA